jgi:hypothetical protein
MARDTHARAALMISRLRLAAFLAAAGFAWWAARADGDARIAAIALASACTIGFAALVVRHARVLDQVDRAEAGIRWNGFGLARLSRDWHALPEVGPWPGVDLDTHPYARDLDLFGHASLTKWLGTPATWEGLRRLCDWLLAPADAAVVAERQAAIDDLAQRAEWRETLAIDGMRTQVGQAELERFLGWAEGTERAVPPAMAWVAVLTPIASLSLLAGFFTGVIDDAWFLIPVTVAIVLSFTFGRRMYAVFDRASVGQGALVRYASMLQLSCTAAWTAPALEQLKEQLCAGGNAPARVGSLARLGGWSELRSSAGIFHFLIQTLTLWDFHVYFAFERWRRRSGRHVRGWIGALGSIDALAVLARIRFDHPDWTQPRVDGGVDRLQASALGHPLIADDRRITNDVRVGPAGTVLLITGSNMSGKSTLLRAIGLNAVLAQAGAPACAAAFAMPPANLQTSIRVQDSLELGLSYFMAALARLKQIVDAAERGAGPGRTNLYLLDEVLQGTNSVERSLAVRAVLRHLLRAGAIGVMTTHDLTMAGEEPMRSAAQLAHFTEQVHADGTMTFDYRLRSGLATSTNALRLMQLIGITPE